MVAHYGMSDALAPSYHEYQEEHAFLGQRIATEGGTSDATIHAIEREAQKLLERALSDAIDLLERHRPELDGRSGLRRTKFFTCRGGPLASSAPVERASSCEEAATTGEASMARSMPHESSTN
jgi:hypothetical protein